MRYLLSLACFLAVTAPLTAAQSALRFVPDTLYFTDRLSSDTLRVVNTSADSVEVSFLQTEPYPGGQHYGSTVGYYWWFDLTTPDTMIYQVYLGTDFEGAPPSFSLAPGDTARFEHLSVAFCICDARRRAWPGNDTLLFRTTSPSRADTSQLVLDTSGYVSAEPSAPDQPALKLSAHPNPAGQTLTVSVEFMPPRRVAMRLVDALGRVVWQWSDVTTSEALTIDVSGYPPGVYALQSWTDDGGWATTRFTVVH